MTPVRWPSRLHLHNSAQLTGEPVRLESRCSKQIEATMIIRSENGEDSLVRTSGPLGGGSLGKGCERLVRPATNTSHGVIGTNTACPQLCFAVEIHSAPTEVGGRG